MSVTEKSPTATCKLIVDAPNSGAWNMAVDELLLESAGTENVAYLRFYQWSAPTLSLGYFQRYADRNQHLPSSHCPVVRRLSGGGGILHDREWTYSLALPIEFPLGKDPAVIYDKVNKGTIAALEELGLAVKAYGDKADQFNGRFLCFQRRAPGDLITGDGHKIMGSAQRRRHGAILQHGSLLLGRSSFAPELPGLAEVAPQADLSVLAPVWSDAVSSALGLEPVPYQLTATQLNDADSIVRARFGRDDWARRR